MHSQDLKHLLDTKAAEYNQPAFIADDPISIPHRFSRLQDIEISGFFAAVLAWGIRKTIINKCTELMERMDNAPYEFVINHTEQDLKRLQGFKHRTFNDTDLFYFMEFFQDFYRQRNSLEDAFARYIKPEHETVEQGLIGFHELFFSLPESPQRTRKHIATPMRGSTCKRLNMYLRWMVRRDTCGVDFGLWKHIRMDQLVCPVDLHVERIARNLGLITRRQVDWTTALELTARLRELDPQDPVKYDFALFGMGVMGEKGSGKVVG